MRVAGKLAMAALAVLAGSCFDRGDRWLVSTDPIGPDCNVGEIRCTANLEQCEDSSKGPGWVTIDDCGAKSQICATALLACANCNPSSTSCNGQDVEVCSADGTTKSYQATCEPPMGEACRDGVCQDLCLVALDQKSNIGCEYWAVDLDNAMINATSNAAAQQFAVVVSNPQPDVPASVHVFQDDTDPGTAGAPYEIASASIAPLNLEVFKLGPREIDGSPPGQYNKGTNTALTRHAYRVTADFPIVVYQFNPLENASVFSNDASLLYPREAFTYDGSSGLGYVVLGWPQTIAVTDNPDTNFDPLHPVNLRATLTIVGTKPETHVRVRPTTMVVGGGPIPRTNPGEEINVTIDPFDVVNLETGGFNADFTGTLIDSDGPIAVFSGSEASDAPHFAKLSERRCCADHLEDQLAPIRTAGKVFAIPHTPSRTRAVNVAGASVEEIPEPDYVRFIATTAAGATIKTTLPKPLDQLVLPGLGSFQEVRAFTDFTAESTEPVLVERVMGSQEAVGIKRGLPGGDPSMLMVPPLEQARADYVFLTPDKYAFDFVSVVAPTQAVVLLDGLALGPDICDVTPADGLTTTERGGQPTLLAYKCQLSFPTIDPSVDPALVSPGAQNDGVHHLASNFPVLVVVMGFDSYVSYEYAAGTDLREIAPPQ